MKKVLFIIGNVIITTIIIISAIFIYNYYSKNSVVTRGEGNNKYAGLEKDLVSREKDLEVLKSLDNYKYLLSKEDVSIFDKSSNEFFDSNEDLAIIVAAHFLFEEPELNNLFEKIKEEISLKKVVYTKEEEDDLFNKNNSCIDLSKSLEEKLPSEETLDVIFYSPKTKSCLYVATKKYRIEANKYNDYSSYGRDIFKIYNSTNQAELGSYITAYSYDYPDKSNSDADIETEKNKANFIKYILESSNYNAGLLEDISFYYSY